MIDPIVGRNFISKK